MIEQTEEPVLSPKEDLSNWIVENFEEIESQIVGECARRCNQHKIPRCKPYGSS